MFFDSPSNIKNLAEKVGFSIFVLPKSLTGAAVEDPFASFSAKNSFRVNPDDKGKISVEQVRDIIDLCKTKQKSPFFVIIKQAEQMNEAAQNAFLKLLEEPAENYHFILTVSTPTALLTTVLSRAVLYTMRIKNPLKTPVEAPEAIKLYAKRIISAKSSDLPRLANDITSDKEYKKKDNARPFTLKIVETAIEILYKSYFATSNPKFLKKLPNLLKLYDNLKQNGHIKLHLVADLC